MPTHQSRHEARTAAQTVTDARPSGEDDRALRMKRYLIAMGVRTLSFPVAVWAFVQEYYLLAGSLAVLAAIIPSFAVMLANAVDRKQAPATAELVSPRQGLGPSPTPPSSPGPPPPAETDVITGTVVSRADTAHPGPGTGSDRTGDDGQDRAERAGTETS